MPVLKAQFGRAGEAYNFVQETFSEEVRFMGDSSSMIMFKGERTTQLC